MQNNNPLKAYTLSVAARRAPFSVGFTAVDDAAALAQATRWFVNSDAYEDESFKVFGPNGVEILSGSACPAQ